MNKRYGLIFAVYLGAFACIGEPGISEPERNGPQDLSAASTIIMINNGYGVIQNVHIIEVLYGAGTYLPGLTNGKIGQFDADVTNSSYMDWLSDYNSPPQTIGRGTFVGTYMITPSAANSGTEVTNVQISTELGAQILAHHLPTTPTHPDQRTDSLYVVHLPRGVVATFLDAAGGQAARSCGPDMPDAPDGTNFCGVHSLADVAPAYGSLFQYAILPDFGPSSGCDVHRDPDFPNRLFTSCGVNTNFDNLTAIVSHELIEAVTDPFPGRSWVEQVPSNEPAAEIADLCERQDATFVGQSGAVWTVQEGWSRTRNACVAHP